MVRVVLADDQEMVCAGLRMLVDFPPDLEVVGEAADGLEAARRVLAAHADVAVVVLTTLDEDASLAEALRAGVGGFLLQTAPPEQLLHATRTVAGGNGLLHPAVTLRVMAAPAAAAAPDPRAAAAPATLARREVEVLRLVAEGLSDAEIAARLSEARRR
jgi:DNA-binding NarL/FixJ family response regulator